MHRFQPEVEPNNQNSSFKSKQLYDKVELRYRMNIMEDENMSKSIGQIIKELRKERNLTQEELAELLSVSGQAVSKWENELCMPDVSQIVPIAKIFGVSTDVLFGTYGESDDDEAMKIIDKAQKQTYDENGKCSVESIYSGYLTVQEGLKRYPNNTILLLFSLERGMALAYPDNDCYDAEHAKAIYEESIRQANIVISYGKNAGDILRAHMIMVLLHSANGNFTQAGEHSYQFPTRADMTTFNMSAYIAHAEQKYTDESKFRQYDFAYLFEALLDNMVCNGNALFLCGKYEDALTVFTSANAMIETVFKDETCLPSIHIRDSGDLYALIAKTYIKLGNADGAMLWLKKMADYELVIRSRYNDMKLKTPVLREVTFFPYYKNSKSRKGYLDSLLEKLSESDFYKLKDNNEYKVLVKHVSDERDKENIQKC